MNQRLFSYLILTMTMLLGSIALHANDLSRLIDQNGNVTLTVTNRPIKEVLDMIEQEGVYRFLYDDQLEGLSKNVTISTEGKSIKSFLDELFTETDLVTKSMESNLIVITSKELAQQSQSAKQGPQEVKGVVIDSKTGEPLPFASVLVSEDRSANTFTDENGNFTLKVSSLNMTLKFVLIGYHDLEIPINGRVKVDAQMEPSITELESVLVVAYGTAKKSTYTGSAALVKEDRLEARPITEVSQALTGAAAGVQVGTSNGQPGSAPTVRIRGLGSFNASNSPLIVLDGMPYDNSISSINPNDIESVTILKDASSAALYGARAANGVMMINTKRGKKDKMQISTKYNLGLTSRQSADYETAELGDYMQLYWEGRRNALLYGGASLEEANALAGSSLLAGMSYNAFNMGADELFDGNTGKINPNAKLIWADDLDWRRQIEQTGIRHDATISISGGNDKTDYYSSIGYLDQQGYIIGSSLTRYSSKANINSQLNKWFKVGTNLNVAITESEGNQNEASGNNSNPFRFMRYVGNIYPIHLHHPETGEYLYGMEGEKLYDFGLGYVTEDDISVPKRDFVSGNNPALELQNIYDGHRRNNINAKTYAEISFLKDFKFTLNIGLGANMYNSWSGSYVYPEKGNAGTSTKSSSQTTTWTINQLLTYDKDIGKHHVDALMGHESYNWGYKYLTASMTGQIIPGDNFDFKNFTESRTIPNSYTHAYRVEGYLSRLNYDYDSKYFASASFRRDGTSRFARTARWGNFWSIGGGWRIDRENFMQHVKAIDMLKFRLSYGVVGNDDLSSYYPWRATYAPYHHGAEPGYLQDELGNSELSWEISRNFDTALEFSLFKARLNGTIEFFHRESSNLLFEVKQPLSSGVDAQNINAGTMYNRGIELTFDYDIVKKRNFSWNVNLNTTFLKNKVVSLPLEPYKSSVYRIEEGHPRYEFWLRQWGGVNPATGYNLFVADLDNDSYVWGEDELIERDGIQYTENIEHAKWDWSGVAIPKATGGFGTFFQYKNWSLLLNFYYQLGGTFYDSTYRSFMAMGTSSLSYSKLHKDLIGRWQKEGDITDIARLSNGNDATNIDAASSTRWLLKSNMLELTNINLAYSFPKRTIKQLGIDGLKIYFSADNALLLTARRGMFPRKNLFSGYDGNSDVYLPSRTISFGVSMNF